MSTAGQSAKLPTTVTGTASPGWWGMVVLIATEATLFGTLLASYFYVRFKSGPEWPPDGLEDPSLGLPLIMTALLLTSSIPMHLAGTGIERGRRGQLKWGLAGAFVLGAVFLGLQVLEYAEKVNELRPSTNAYGSFFYTITGFHGLHVAVGLVMNAWTQARAWAGHFDEKRHVTVQNVVMYWHFVDVVWIFVLASLYIAPRL
jgi:heme/copper-type cytochrome/quinol oxidase subunit 3